MPRISNAILWHSNKSGLWFCEIYGPGMRFESIGIGRSKQEAQERAAVIAGWPPQVFPQHLITDGQRLSRTMR